MFNSKFNGLLTGLLIAAIVGIIALIGYFGWSVYNKYYINAGASDAVDAFEHQIGQNNNTVTPPQESNVEENREQIGEVGEGNSIYTGNQGGGNSNATTQYGGYDVIGTISIPKINIKYPILEKVTPKSIKLSVAYLAGAGINQVGNTVIQGHNYRNGMFFSDLDKLVNGDAIYIKDPTGTEIKYEVYDKFEAEGTDSSFYNRDTNGLREITLSTCTDDGTKRTIILAREVV